MPSSILVLELLAKTPHHVPQPPQPFRAPPPRSCATATSSSVIVLSIWAGEFARTAAGLGAAVRQFDTIGMTGWLRRAHEMEATLSTP